MQPLSTNSVTTIQVAQPTKPVAQPNTSVTTKPTPLGRLGTAIDAVVTVSEGAQSLVYNLGTGAIKLTKYLTVSAYEAGLWGSFKSAAIAIPGGAMLSRAVTLVTPNCIKKLVKEDNKKEENGEKRDAVSIGTEALGCAVIGSAQLCHVLHTTGAASMSQAVIGDTAHGIISGVGGAVSDIIGVGKSIAWSVAKNGGEAALNIAQNPGPIFKIGVTIVAGTVAIKHAKKAVESESLIGKVAYGTSATLAGATAVLPHVVGGKQFIEITKNVLLELLTVKGHVLDFMTTYPKGCMTAATLAVTGVAGYRSYYAKSLSERIKYGAIATVGGIALIASTVFNAQAVERAQQ